MLISKMKILYTYPIYVFLLIIMVSCGSETVEKNKAVIVGKYLPSESKIYLLKVHANNIRLLDSADISDDASFIFSFNSPDNALFRLEREGLYPLIVVAKNGDTVRVGQVEDPAWPYRVSGNNECLLVASYLEQLKRDERKVDSLSYIFNISQGHPDFLMIRENLNEEFIRIHEAHKQYAINFVSRNPGSFASLIMINSFFREFLLFNQMEDFKYYEMVDEAVMKKMPENKYAIDLHEQVERIRASNEFEYKAAQRLSQGRMVPEFELPSLQGDLKSPQDFQGKFLLIYFWAAADAKSRQTNPFVKQIFNTYNKYGLELMSISFDVNKTIWKAALDLDALPGIQLIDIEGGRSPVHKLFNLKMQLPAYFLIDSKGRIYKHDRDFDKLEPDIKELFSNPPKY